VRGEFSVFYRVRRFNGFVAVAALAITLGCETAKSSNPTSPSVAGPIPGVNITAPRPLEPFAGSELIADGGLVTLLIENAGTSGQRELWLQVELASDGNFQQILHQVDRLTPGGAGRTSYRVPSPLAAGYTYYWRARAMDGANTGPYSTVSNFKMIAPVVIETPVPLEPAGNLTTNKPTFKVRNPNFSGTNSIVIRFDVSESSDFYPVLAVVTAPLGGGGTTSMTLGDLPYDKVIYWRTYATDFAVNSPLSNVVAFKTPAPPPPPPPPTPTPTPTPIAQSGYRTPDPPPGQRLPLPNESSVVQQVARDYPGLLQRSCQESGGTWEFMDRVVDTLRSHDTRWGYNGKRGNTSDPSKDVVDYNWGNQKDEGTTQVYIIDIINGHCGSSPSPAWNDVTQVTLDSGTIGKWTGRGRF
jgi:hypothetical protein